MSEYVVTGTGGSTRTTSTERVQILAGIQGPAGRDGSVFNFRGKWDATTQYSPDDAVYYEPNGALYLATDSSLNEAPPDFESKWATLADPTVGWVNHITAQDGDHTNFQPRHGFPVDDVTLDYFTNIIYDDVTRTFEISATGTDGTLGDPDNEYRIYNRGTRVVKTGPTTVTHPDTTGRYYVYFDQNNDLVATTYSWTLELHNPVGFIYYNATTSEGVLYDKRYTAHRDPRLHEAIKNSLGQFLQNGFNLSDYTLSPGAPAAADVRWTQAQGEVRDVDISTLIDAVDATSLYTIASRSGTAGEWVFEEDVTTPVAFTTTGFAEWNQFTGSTWQRTAGVTGDFINYFVFVAPAVSNKRAVVIVPGQAAHASLALAQAEILESLDLGDGWSEDATVSWRIITELNTTYTTEGKHRIVQVDQVFKEKFGRVTQNNPTDHQALSNRTASSSHPASAIDNTPYGEIGATTVQAAIDELEDEKYGAGDIIKAYDGTSTVPGLTFNGFPTAGFMADAASTVRLILNGTEKHHFYNTHYQLSGQSLAYLQIGDDVGRNFAIAAIDADVAGFMDNSVSSNSPHGVRIFKYFAALPAEDSEYLRFEWDATDSTWHVGTQAVDLGPGPEGVLQSWTTMYGDNPRLKFDASGVVTYSSILPDTDGARDLGSPSLRFNNVYALNIAAVPGGTVSLDNGLETAPALTWTSDPDSGFYWTGADSFYIALGGAEQMSFTTDGFMPQGPGTHNLGESTRAWDISWSRRFLSPDQGSAAAPVIADGVTDIQTGIFFNDLPSISDSGVDQGFIIASKMAAATERYGGNIPSPAAATTRHVARAVGAGTVKKIYAIVEGSLSSCTVNVQRAGLDLRSADLVVTEGTGWQDFGTLQNTTVAAGDAFQIEIVAVAGAPTEVAIQIEVEPA